MRTALPWILLALVAGGWIGATLFGEARPPVVHPTPDGALAAAGTATELAELRAVVEALRAEVQTLRAERPIRGPTLETAGTVPSRPAPRKVEPRSEDYKAREAARRNREAAQAQRKSWYDAVRSLKDASARETALAEMRAAFDGEDEARKLVALQLARWLGNVKYDRDDWRRAILPHARSEDPDTRAAALIALAYVKPDASDLSLWAAAVEDSGRSNAEEMAHAIVRTAEGVLRGEAADAVLHLLRPGTNIKKAFVIRGLQSVKEWDPAVEARLIEIVRAAPAHDYDSGYFFHFITPRMDPKSDAILDLMLDKIEEGKSEIQTLVRGFRTGLDARQKDRAADALLGCAENAGTTYTVRFIAEALGYVARAQHVGRMEALIAGEDVDKYVKAAMERAIRDARSR